MEGYKLTCHLLETIDEHKTKKIQRSQLLSQSPILVTSGSVSSTSALTLNPVIERALSEWVVGIGPHPYVARDSLHSGVSFPLPYPRFDDSETWDTPYIHSDGCCFRAVLCWALGRQWPLGLRLLQRKLFGMKLREAWGISKVVWADKHGERVTKKQVKRSHWGTVGRSWITRGAQRLSLAAL